MFLQRPGSLTPTDQRRCASSVRWNRLLATSKLNGQPFSCRCSCQAGISYTWGSLGMALTLEQQFCNRQAEEETSPHRIGA